MIALLGGAARGMAMEYISARYSTTATELVRILQPMRGFGRVADDRELAQLWLAANDARNFVVVGDPAIRLTAQRSPPGGHNLSPGGTVSVEHSPDHGIAYHFVSYDTSGREGHR